MSRVIGVDWGSVRVGIAMSDEEGKLAFPLHHTLETKSAIDEIKKLTEEYEVAKIVIGLPLNLQGKVTGSAEKTKKFGEQLSKKTGLPIDYFDERFTSVASTKSLQEQEIKEKDQRQIKDNIAAALLLQQYLEKNKN
jgi:putative Holliday junction resolvase